MRKHDYHTGTVDGARAWAERHAEHIRAGDDGDATDYSWLEHRAYLVLELRSKAEDLCHVDEEMGGRLIDFIDELERECSQHG